MKAKNNALKIVCLIALLSLPLAISQALAADMASLVNTAGMQRMLSQRVTKDYLFLGSQIRAGKATRQLKGSVALMVNNHEVLKKEVTDSRVQDLLKEIDPLMEKMVKITKSPYVKFNGATMLELSGTLLELNQAVVKELEGKQAEKAVEAVNVAGRQRMLSQRIAMFYAAHQAGFKSDSTVAEMKQAVEEFEAAHARLEKNSLNSDKINRELKGVENLWKTIRHYFTESSEAGFPVTIFVTTDDIMKRMNTITLLYVKAYWASKKQ
ncbi:type IV pili methyl-accepting chemotaxis transducer N-terminal domain-containing protein [Sedimenticola sp.]|uniref:type IV pili methyl-accepting chemotaxis transducer N-terminal domain-containing protein n=1 Tax=Sedimenticola sp. TaxID=1940285 RepID=UPI003D14D4E3